MFSPLGLFKGIPCPQGQNCNLLTCIFSHDAVTTGVSQQDAHTTSDHNRTKVTGITTTEARPSKRIKLETNPEDRGSSTKTISTTESDTASSIQSIPQLQKDKKEGAANATLQEPTSARSPMRHGQPSPAPTTTKKISPPPTTRGVKQKQGENSNSNSSSPSGGGLPPRNAPKESLNPRMLAKAPASHAVRTSILTKLHAAMSGQNEKLAREVSSSKGDPEKEKERFLVLSPNELVTMALDEEEKAAKEDANVYGNVIKYRIVKVSRMSTGEWVGEVKKHLHSRYYKDIPTVDARRQEGQEGEEKKKKPFSTGLSRAEELAIAEKLVTPLNGLEQFGYVTKAPSQEEIETAQKGVAESRGWEKCDRCAGRFQVFPGRREDGSLTSGGQCTYHPARVMYPSKKRTDHVTGSGSPFFPCCNETLGTSIGCTKSPSHVFKVTETKRLASILQFEHTPPQQQQQKQQEKQPLSIDCEMGYTTLGMELIRLTAVSWPEGKEVLDVLVKPIGEVLDLNSRWSGVLPEHYASALPYGTAAASEDRETNQATSQPPPPSPPQNHTLQVVDSPSTARSLLFQHITPDTPLIGHAIDNDLNTCRIIHPTVIDTVLLYPHPKGLPLRTGLKALCLRFLEREIQTGGGAHGHDSKEDAIATGDLVRAKAVETWKVLKGKGWVIRDGRLVAPDVPGGNTSGDDDVVAERSLRPGAGSKRKEV